MNIPFRKKISTNFFLEINIYFILDSIFHALHAKKSIFYRIFRPQFYIYIFFQICKLSFAYRKYIKYYIKVLHKIIFIQTDTNRQAYICVKPQITDLLYFVFPNKALGVREIT